MTSTGTERLRILIDVTVAWQFGPGSGAAEAVRAEREIARRLLADTTLLTLPVVFAADRIYAVTAEDATARLSSALHSSGSESGRQQRAPDAAAQSRSGPAGWKGALSRTGLRVARWGATMVYRLTPQRAQGELLQFFRQGKRVASSVLRPAAAVPSRSAAVDAAELASNPIVYPSRGDLVWCSGIASGLPLRRLAEERQRHGFALAAVCWSLDAESAAAQCDVLDAADVILCASDRVMGDLRTVAAANGRKPPDLRRVDWTSNADGAEDRLRTDLTGVARSLGLA